MSEAYRTISEKGRDEFVVSRSRFIGWSSPAATEADALAFIESVRKEHWDASHNVWAYVTGGARERYSDAGEPQGTAGLPVLEVIRKEGIRDAAVVVTRYFGGVKLGAGGLVRAYSHGAKLALEAGKIIRRIPFISCEVICDYSNAGKIKKEAEDKRFIVENAAYLDHVAITILVPGEELDTLHTMVAEITAGKGSVTEGGEEYIDFQKIRGN
jgi:uncharacterized YigZ family protein